MLSFTIVLRRSLGDVTNGYTLEKIVVAQSIMRRWKKEQRENEENLFQFFIPTIFFVPWLGDVN